MLATRIRPYPTDGWDTSLFEDQEEAIHISEAEYEMRRPCQTLAQLVEEGQFAEAAHIRQELGQIGVTIQPDTVYARVAAHEALSLCNPDPLERITTFMTWWSLVPLPDATDILWKSRCLQQDILATYQIPDPRRVIVAALHVAREGYSVVTANLFLPYIIPKSSRTFITAFLSDTCAADSAYLSTRASQDAAEQHQQRCQSLYCRAIKTLCILRRVDDALDLLRLARNRRFALNKSTYYALLLELRRVQDTSAAALVQKYWKEQGGIGQILHVEPPLRGGHALREAFHQITAQVSNDKLPRVADISRYIHSCLSSGDYSALSTLRARCFDSSRGREIVCNWAREEMKYFMQTGQKEAVLTTFDKYFLMVGTPSQTTMSRIVSQKRQSQRNGALKAVVAREEQSTPSEPRLAFRHPEQHLHSEHYVPGYLLSSVPLTTEKMTPTRFHNIYVWAALARMSSRETLQELYTDFIGMVGQLRPHLDSQGPIQMPPIGGEYHTSSSGLGQSRPNDFLVPREQEPLFDVVHFNTFIRAFALRRQPRQAYGVLTDMCRLGVSPDVETYTTLLSALTAGPYLRDVISVLDLAETARTSYTPGYRGVARTDDALEIRPAVEVLMLATTAMERYLDRGDLASARYIRRRLIGRHAYKIGTNRITDAALLKFDEMWNGRPEASHLNFGYPGCTHNLHLLQKAPLTLSSITDGYITHRH